jgi:1,5-anhydro-D-fructose reductase (1,5-anhydro-D-mannitol-forming)
VIACAIIGFGTMGRIRARALEDSGRASLVRICDVNPIPGLGAECRSSTVEEILGDTRVQAVFICTPNHLNKALTVAALRAGKHAFCEKPPAFSAADVEDIREVERASGRILAYGFNHRHHESIKKAKAVIDGGTFGRLLWMRGRYGKSVNPDFFHGWRADHTRAGGGIMLDQGIHMLDLFLHFAGDFDEVQALVSNLFWKLPGIEDNVFAQFRNSSTGVAASLHATMTQWRHLFSLEIFLERGHIVLNGLVTTSGAYGPEILTLARNRAEPPVVQWGPDETMTYDTDTSWASEVREFLDAILAIRPLSTGTSADALRVMRIIDRIYQPSRT